MTNRTSKKRILVLMSGGVDSSAAAAILKNSGYNVTGVYLKLWEETRNNKQETLGDPCWAAEMRDAARAAAHLGIPFQIWDVTEEYKKRVLENFYTEYTAGRTPNPDVLCNSEIKFGAALERALAERYDYVASGHYARLRREIRNSKFEIRNKSKIPNSKLVLSDTGYVLRAGRDSAKDQSYFLWRLNQEQLRHVMFPIGKYTKPQVRALARKFRLHNWNKKDSQGVCFLGKIRLKEFLYNNKSLALSGSTKLSFDRSAGPILDVHGNLLGFHDVLAHFTVGQRHGMNLGNGQGPYFVIEKDMKRNALIVANEEDESQYRVTELRIKDQRLRIEGELECRARVRYRGSLVDVRVTPIKNSMIHNSSFIIQFKEPQRAVAPGQSIVFYQGDRVIGGGIIGAVTLKNSLTNATGYRLQVT